MAQAQILLHHQPSRGQSQDLQSQLSLLQHTGQYNPPSFGYVQDTRPLADSHTMSETSQVPVPQYPSNEFVQHSLWACQQLLSQDTKPASIADGGIASANELALGHLWVKPLALDQVTAWHYNTPRVAPDWSGEYGEYYQNAHLFYDPAAALDAAAARHGSYGGQLIWTSSAMRGHMAATCASVADFDSVNSLSPQSYLSDGVDNSFSPCSLSDQASSRGDWMTSASPSVSLKVSSPLSGPSIPQASLPLACNRNVKRRPEFTSLPGRALALAGPLLLPQANDAGHGLHNSYDGAHPHIHGDPLASMAASGSSASWHMPGYSSPPFDAKLTLHNSHVCETNIDNDVCVSATSHSSGYSSFESPSRTDCTRNMDPQVHGQSHTDVSSSSSAEALRQHDDEVLLRGKREGLTYREIRKKMLGEKVAESTLRGRYRSLTKAKKDRVRKPVWHKRDIELLNGFVGQDLERIEKSLMNPDAVSLEQKLVKVRWKEVAEYIEKRGGSYLFGNSTCKRKWKELHSDTK